MNHSELTNYMSRAIEGIVADVLRNTLRNPKETAFLLKYRAAVKKASEKRERYENQGRHLPAFLISSITNSCNLHCKGCYARSNGICRENEPKELLAKEEWHTIFKQGEELGISFHLLAGGEPLLRTDVLSSAAEFGDTIFPVFTNGTLLDGEVLDLFDRHRNLVPVLSIEGSQEKTDGRRGEGTYRNLIEKMEQLSRRKILFGTSITVTTENLSDVTAPAFLNTLKRLGCRIVLFVEYVPVDPATRSLAFTGREREQLAARQVELRKEFPAMLLLSFPGDEAKMGGCLAAGRGFFHISPYGDAEACPFSPYSDLSLKNHTLLDALDSPFFKRLQAEELAGGEHRGGCVLFEKEEKVKELLRQ